MMTLEINNFVGAHISLKFLNKIAEKIFKKEKVKKGKLSFALVDEKVMRQLNKWYRGENRVTDVLSFEMLKPKNFVLPSQEETYLGEIIICYPLAKRQARENGHSIKREIETLFIHGLLHLLGYSHQKMKKFFLFNNLN